MVWIRWTFPRTQFYGLLNLSWKILIPVSLVTLILSSAMMKLLPRMKNSLKEIATGFNSLLTGMRITLGQFFKPTVTVQYPHESLKMPERFRGHIELVRDPETGKAICFACKLCERACPSDCITVEGAKLDGAKKKSVTKYMLDFTKCSLCGSCVEACRDGAIRFSTSTTWPARTRRTTSWTSSSAWKTSAWPSRGLKSSAAAACVRSARRRSPSADRQRRHRSRAPAPFNRDSNHSTPYR